MIIKKERTKVYIKKLRKGCLINSLKSTKTLSIIFLQKGQIFKKHLEAIRQNVKRKLKKRKIFFITNPHFFNTSKPLTRMGKGKGSIKDQLTKTRPGNKLFIVKGIPTNYKKIKPSLVRSPVKTFIKIFSFAGVKFEPTTFRS